MFVNDLLFRMETRVKMYFKFHNVLIMLMMMMMAMTACCSHSRLLLFVFVLKIPQKTRHFLIYRCSFLHEWMNLFRRWGECFSQFNELSRTALAFYVLSSTRIFFPPFERKKNTIKKRTRAHSSFATHF